jgi:hypothetical protein
MRHACRIIGIYILFLLRGTAGLRLIISPFPFPVLHRMGGRTSCRAQEAVMHGTGRISVGCIVAMRSYYGPCVKHHQGARWFGMLATAQPQHSMRSWFGKEMHSLDIQILSFQIMTLPRQGEFKQYEFWSHGNSISKVRTADHLGSRAYSGF